MLGWHPSLSSRPHCQSRHRRWSQECVHGHACNKQQSTCCEALLHVSCTSLRAWPPNQHLMWPDASSAHLQWFEACFVVQDTTRGMHILKQSFRRPYSSTSGLASCKACCGGVLSLQRKA